MKHDYVCSKIYTEEDCIALRDAFVTNINTSLKDVPAEGIAKTSDVVLTNHVHLKDLLHKATQFVLNVNKTYFGYDLYPVVDDDVLFLNIYDWHKNATYGWHKDLTTDDKNYDYKLTVLLNISDSYYQGGQLKIFTTGGEHTIHEFSEPGTICVFPSFTPHSVCNVTLGTRKTITHFFLGPRFR